MFQVIFRREGEGETRVQAAPGETLLEAARRAGVAIDAPCAGQGACGKCRVRLLEGALDSPANRHLSDADYAAGWRLACASRVEGDVAVEVPAAASAYRAGIRTADLGGAEALERFGAALDAIRDAGVGFENDFVSLEPEMPEPSLDDPAPDVERLVNAILEDGRFTDVRIPHAVMRALPRALRENGFRVRVLGEADGETLRLLRVAGPEEDAAPCALGIDIGTTTVSAVLMDLETGRVLARGSAGNGQIRYGADVISRILECGKPGGLERMRKAVADETVRPLVDALERSAGVAPERVVSVCVAANTTMNHLFAGIDPNPIRVEPYVPAFFAWDGLRAGDAGLPVHPDARITLAPNIGSYVGGDITAGVLPSLLWKHEGLSLFIDLGTNGEIVLGGSDFMMACACSAGPAFEGGDISRGMRATRGAIEAVRIDEATMEPTLRVIGEAGERPAGLCGSGLIDAVAELFRCGVISPKGRFIREGRRVSRDAAGFACYVLAFPEESADGRAVTLNSVDIDNFIRAKGAVFSAICTMLGALELDVDAIDGVIVAGGIGSGIDMESAVRVGMFPKLPPERFRYIGNAALTGACAMALSTPAREKVFELARGMTYMELSATPGYMEEFVAACFLPHTNAEMFA